jgi:hypothetical protein
LEFDVSERASLKIVQILVDVGEGDYCAVSLSQDRKDMLVGFIEALSEGPIKLVRLPGLKMIPVSELERSQ